MQSKFQAREELIADDRLWLEYLKKHGGALFVETIKILSDMSRRKTGKFLVIKLLKDRSIWIGEHDVLFMVHDLFDPFEMLMDDIPCLVEASILPLFNKIVYDGFVKPYAVASARTCGRPTGKNI